MKNLEDFTTRTDRHHACIYRNILIQRIIEEKRTFFEFLSGRMLVLLAVFENILKAFIKDTEKVGNTMESTHSCCLHSKL